MLLTFCLFPQIALGDSAPIIPAPGGNVRPVQNEDIILHDEVIDIFLYKDNYSVNVNYTFINTGKDQEITMGFPNMEGSDYASIKDFKAYDGEQKLGILKKYDVEQQTDGRGKKYYECFKTLFKSGEAKKIKNAYSQGYLEEYEINSSAAKYILTTGSLWKDKISSIKVNIYLKDIPVEEFQKRVAYFSPKDIKSGLIEYSGLEIKPANYTVTGNKVEMSFSDIDPDFDIEINKPDLLVRDFSAGLTLSDGKVAYFPQYVYDNDLNTAWVEGARGPGIGESITLKLTPYAFGKHAGAYLIKKIGIINGYAKSEAIFHANNRVKKIKVAYFYKTGDWGDEVASPKLSETFELKDTMEMQFIELKEPKLISEIEFTILDVYKGKKYDDTGISEIRVYPIKK